MSISTSLSCVSLSCVSDLPCRPVLETPVGPYGLTTSQSSLVQFRSVSLARTGNTTAVHSGLELKYKGFLAQEDAVSHCRSLTTTLPRFTTLAKSRQKSKPILAPCSHRIFRTPSPPMHAIARLSLKDENERSSGYIWYDICSTILITRMGSWFALSASHTLLT